ncbi:hypothetical protein SPRG_17208 [Saprolegnia parasitica CBS 223.65]|uniref:t-SNARE coiled-coil homology domain-containing protein n=1 Tax=Saprolegnia parasitica (strain CBS 223.65) TaxID=695850 RepID=A0A067BG33_SAPPC|nr:hypothetical protein SPRG_17208 [Saprolegnia parasitica CBS 223.65]KDO17359.1 hypothetical protein SPRG_17208 [Saprolegnia parasitica CBS 223.65]|eukprot:XP_012211930.1 hypothetical protein SPRG_17208 [Saprolegnia parasitica CBS 223.65]
MASTTTTTAYRRYDLEHQEADLDVVYAGARSLHTHARDIHNEVQIQNPMLDNLNRDVEAGADELRIQAEKAAYVNAQRKKVCWYYGVIAILVVTNVLLYAISPPS